MKTIQVIENIEEHGTEWVISLTDSNPNDNSCFIAPTGKEAFRIKKMLEAWANGCEHHFVPFSDGVMICDKCDECVQSSE